MVREVLIVSASIVVLIGLTLLGLWIALSLIVD